MTTTTRIPIALPLRRGRQRLRFALIGMPNSGKSTLFEAVASTSPRSGELAGTQRTFSECVVQVGLDEAGLIDLPSVHSLHHASNGDLATLKYLMWGDQRPPVSAHEPTGPPAPYAPPDAIIQVIDALALERHLELTLELTQLERPLVIALNMMDQARDKGLTINVRALSTMLGVPVVPIVALMGQGIAELFSTTVATARARTLPRPQPPSTHIWTSLQPLAAALAQPEIDAAFRVPRPLLLAHFAAGDRYFHDEVRQHFPKRYRELEHLRHAASRKLPRPVREELHADRHHRAATLFESATRLGPPHANRDWRYWLDELFLHPQWGLIGSLLVFAAVLFVVFEVSAWLDSMTAARLVEAVADWRPQSTEGVVGRAVVDGLIGLIGIVVPYMIPLVLLLVALEEIGIMQRIAFVVDRGFHKIGVHGGVAVPFLLGLGCNVPAISSAARASTGRERLVASLLITFVPCSARSAIVLALAGKYLGGAGVFAIFALTVVVIAIMGRLLARGHRPAGPGQIQEIPSYALPHWRTLLMETWMRSRDIVTIVTPLLVGGSVVLALLTHAGADRLINTALLPVTAWWLGLPMALGVPLLFGVLRKELSLLMIYQALGTFDVGALLSAAQILTLLLFLTFYVPCVSTFAVMLKTIGRRNALISVGLSIGVAMLVSGILRVLLELPRWLAA